MVPTCPRYCSLLMLAVLATSCETWLSLPAKTPASMDTCFSAAIEQLYKDAGNWKDVATPIKTHDWPPTVLLPKASAEKLQFVLDMEEAVRHSDLVPAHSLQRAASTFSGDIDRVLRGMQKATTTGTCRCTTEGSTGTCDRYFGRQGWMDLD